MASAKRGRRNAFAESGRSETVRELYAAAEEAAQQPQTSGQGKPGHAGQKGVDKRGQTKKTLYLDLETQSLIEELSASEGIPQSDVVILAVRVLAQAITRGLDIQRFKYLDHSEKQPWRSTTRLNLPAETDFFSSATQP